MILFDILYGVIVMVFLVTLHELGHYLFAWRLGWKPKLTYEWRKFRFAVITREINIDINTESQFLKAYSDLARFNGASTLFTLAGIVFLVALDFMSTDAAFLISMVFTLYGLHEIMNPKFEGVKE